MVVAASGTEPLSYHWKKNGETLEGFGGPRVEILNVQAEDSGSYTVTVSNLGGEVTSEEAVVVVNEPIAIISQPIGNLKPIGASAEFKVQVRGTNPIKYQWLKNSEKISGATSDNLKIENVHLEDSGEYQVLISNPAGELLSGALRCGSHDKGGYESIRAQVREGQPYELNILASGTEPISYQWYKDGIKIENATAPEYKIERSSELDSGLSRCDWKRSWERFRPKMFWLRC